MIIVEGLLFALLIIVSSVASISDLRRGTIPNKLLIYVLPIGIVLDTIYYWKFEQIAGSVLINLAVMFLISILFYAFHVWSAGDSKLSVLLMLLVPGRIYCNSSGNVAPGILIFIFIFSIGFIYVIAESVVLGIKRRNILSLKGIRFNFKDFIIRFFSIAAILFLLSQAISITFPSFFTENSLLVLFINLFIILLLQDQKWLNQLAYAIPLGLICVGTALLTKVCYVIDWCIYTIVALVILLRAFAEKYNYDVIETSKIKAGMILSLGTIMHFNQSQIRGLPKYTTEDLRTKLTDEEVEAIHRWEKTKSGKSTVIIVRKLPFAIIISASTILFVVTEVFLL
jgi:preflagellin peptidase FlaK